MSGYISQDDETHYINNQYYPDVVEYEGQGTTASGVVTISLTKPDGSAVFSQVFMPTLKVRYWSSTAVLTFNNPVVSADMKTLTINAYQQALSLGILSLNSAANGIVIYVSIKGMASIV